MNPADIPLPLPEWLRPLPQPQITEFSEILNEVDVASEPGFRSLSLDFYRPLERTKPLPLIVFIHGGAFLFGIRKEHSPFLRDIAPGPFERLAQQGFAVASVEYRLSGEAQFPAQLHDISAALRYLNYRADELGVDIQRVAIWGESAGAHLAMLAAFLQNDDDALGRLGAPCAPIPISYLVDWFGLADVRGPMGPFPFPGPTPEERLLGGSASELPELARAASPVEHARTTLAGALVMHGRDDDLIPLVHSERIAEALADAGTPVTTYWLDGAGHGWSGRADAPLEAFQITEEWLREELAS